MSPQDDATGPRSQPQGSPRAYVARVLERPVVDESGIRHGEQEAREEIGWSRIRWAIAAEVGEPQGVRTIVFDLLTRGEDDAWRAHRLDAEPGEDAMALARVALRGLGDERKVPSLRSLATDGIPARWYPDLQSFEEDVVEELASATS